MNQQNGSPRFNQARTEPHGQAEVPGASPAADSESRVSSVASGHIDKQKANKSPKKVKKSRSIFAPVSIPGPARQATTLAGGKHASQGHHVSGMPGFLGKQSSASHGPSVHATNGITTSVQHKAVSGRKIGSSPMTTTEANSRIVPSPPRQEYVSQSLGRSRSFAPNSRESLGFPAFTGKNLSGAGQHTTNHNPASASQPTSTTWPAVSPTTLRDANQNITASTERKPPRVTLHSSTKPVPTIPVFGRATAGVNRTRGILGDPQEPPIRGFPTQVVIDLTDDTDDSPGRSTTSVDLKPQHPRSMPSLPWHSKDYQPGPLQPKHSHPVQSKSPQPFPPQTGVSYHHQAKFSQPVPPASRIGSSQIQPSQASPSQPGLSRVSHSEPSPRVHSKSAPQPSNQTKASSGAHETKERTHSPQNFSAAEHNSKTRTPTTSSVSANRGDDETRRPDAASRDGPSSLATRLALSRAKSLAWSAIRGADSARSTPSFSAGEVDITNQDNSVNMTSLLAPGKVPPSQSHAEAPPRISQKRKADSISRDASKGSTHFSPSTKSWERANLRRLTREITRPLMSPNNAGTKEPPREPTSENGKGPPLFHSQARNGEVDETRKPPLSVPEIQRREKVCRLNSLTFDSQFYAQDDTLTPPPGVLEQPNEQPVKSTDEKGLDLHVNPAVHGMHPRSKEWHELKAAEIKDRGRRKEWIGDVGGRKQKLQSMERDSNRRREAARALGTETTRKDPEPWSYHRNLEYSDIPSDELPVSVQENAPWLKFLARAREHQKERRKKQGGEAARQERVEAGRREHEGATHRQSEEEQRRKMQRNAALLKSLKETQAYFALKSNGVA